MHFRGNMDLHKQEKQLLWLHGVLEIGLWTAPCMLGCCCCYYGMWWKNIKYIGAHEPLGNKGQYGVVFQNLLLHADGSVLHHFSAYQTQKHPFWPSEDTHREVEPSLRKKGHKTGKKKKNRTQHSHLNHMLPTQATFFFIQN